MRYFDVASLDLIFTFRKQVLCSLSTVPSIGLIGLPTLWRKVTALFVMVSEKYVVARTKTVLRSARGALKQLIALRLQRGVAFPIFSHNLMHEVHEELTQST